MASLKGARAYPPTTYHSPLIIGLVAAGVVVAGATAFMMMPKADLPEPKAEVVEAPPEPEDKAPEAVPEVSQEANDVSQEANDVSQEANDVSQEANDVSEKAVIAPPSFDLVRVEADGSAVIAGRGAPGSQVTILLDSDVLNTVEPDGSGAFVSLLTIEPSGEPRVLALSMLVGEETVASEQTVIVAPVEAAPLVLAEVASEAKTEPEAAPQSDEVTLPEQTDTARKEDVAVAEVEPSVPAISQAPVSETVANPIAPEPSEADADPQITPKPDDVEAEPATPATEPEPATPASEPATPTTEPVAPAADAKPEAPAVESTTPAAQPKAPEVEPEPEAPVAKPEPEAPVDKPAQAPAILLADAEGVTVLQSEVSPEVMSSVALDTISYDATGEVVLGGRAPGSGFVRVYLDDKPVTVSRISEDGSWRTDLPQIDTGIYQLRVDEVAASGEVTSRIETPFKREAPETVETALAELKSEGKELKVRTVQPGATLWQIARERYGSGALYVKVFEANRDRIRDPDMIFPGQVFDIPE